MMAAVIVLNTFVQTFRRVVARMKTLLGVGGKTMTKDIPAQPTPTPAAAIPPAVPAAAEEEASHYDAIEFAHLDWVKREWPKYLAFHSAQAFHLPANFVDAASSARSEERRVGKEGRSRWLSDH